MQKEIVNLLKKENKLSDDTISEIKDIEKRIPPTLKHLKFQKTWILNTLVKIYISTMKFYQQILLQNSYQ